MTITIRHQEIKYLFPRPCRTQKAHLGLLDKFLDKLVVHTLVHVNALDGTTALSGVEHCSVDKVDCAVLDVRVCAHISRIFSAELYRQVKGSLSRCLSWVACCTTCQSAPSNHCSLQVQVL